MNLENLAFEEVRRNWPQYKERITPFYYEELWNNFQTKFKISDNVYLPMLKEFINGDSDTTITNGMSAYERKQVHELCDIVGLHHQSKYNKAMRSHIQAARVAMGILRKEPI